MSAYEEFSTLLNQYLNRAERSQSWLADKLGISRSTISRWSNHYARPNSSEIVFQIAELLGIGEEDSRKLLRSAGYDYTESASEKKTRFTELRNVLATLYPDPSSARRIVQDAGINLSRLRLKDHAVNNWHEILNEATKQGVTKNLIDTVRQEYGSNRTFQRVIDEYNQTLPQLSFFRVLGQDNDEQAVEGSVSYSHKIKEGNDLDYAAPVKRTTTSDPDYKLVTLTLHRDLDSYSKEEQDQLLRVISELLRVGGELKITKISPG